VGRSSLEGSLPLAPSPELSRCPLGFTRSLHCSFDAQAPDGSLYITNSQKGAIWRVLYTGR